jgi:transposase
LNPIENLWSIIKARRQKKYGVPQSKTDLIQQIFEIWDEIDEELCATLAESIRKRLVEQVLKRKGEVTKY